MENHARVSRRTLTVIMQHLPTALAEIDPTGHIRYLNTRAEALLKPVRIASGVCGDNLFPLLREIAPEVLDTINSAADDEECIVENMLQSFTLSFGEEIIERHFNYSVAKLSEDSILVSIDDLTDQKRKESAILQLSADKAVEQGKYEIASNVLHDIGNAVVGFGSYINRMKRALDAVQPEALEKLSSFMSAQQPALASAMGDARSKAVVNMLSGLHEQHRKGQEEIAKSLREQVNIIKHIQEMLTIQRQYVTGHATLEKKPANLRSIVNDCMAMLYASLEKRGIRVAISIPPDLPSISADHTRLMQVVLNLLKNSLEAIPLNAEQKLISIQAITAGDDIILQLHDTGQGFDNETGEQLFVRGFTTKASGTGLGLANCRAIIESHNGTIAISSEGFGKGSTTTIKFKNE